MNKKVKNEKGITIIALIITVVVLVIIASISITAGSQLIQEAKTQTIETNMLAIRAKAKSYAEEIEAATWALSSSEDPEKDKETRRTALFHDKRDGFGRSFWIWAEHGKQ